MWCLTSLVWFLLAEFVDPTQWGSPSWPNICVRKLLFSNHICSHLFTIVCGIVGTLAGGFALDFMTNTLSNAFKVSIQIRDFICYVDQYTHCNFFLAFWIIHLSFLITLINNSLSLHPLILQLLSVTTFLGAAFCFGAFLCRNVNGFLVLFSIGELLVFSTQVLSFYARKISVFNC
jgi:hypothetical protein